MAAEKKPDYQQKGVRRRVSCRVGRVPSHAENYRLGFSNMGLDSGWPPSASDPRIAIDKASPRSSLEQHAESNPLYVIRSLRWRTADCLGQDHTSMADLLHFATRIEYWDLLSP